jgi:hypothetical protein
MFQLHTAIIRPVPQNRSKFDFVKLGSQDFAVLKYMPMVYGSVKLLEHCTRIYTVYIQYFDLIQYTEIHFNSNNFNLTTHRKQYTRYFSTVNSWDPNCTKSNMDLFYGRGLMVAVWSRNL